MANFNRKLIWAALLGLGIFVVLTFAADFRETTLVILKFKIAYLPLVLGLTFVNYLLRFVKWQFFLKQLDIIISPGDSFRIFLSGLAMSVTPGKAGEIIKSLLLKELSGAAVSRTAPVIFAERLSDGFALIILSLSGITVFHYGREVLAAALLLMAAFVLVFKLPGVHNPLINGLSHMPVLRRFAGSFEVMVESAVRLMSLKGFLYTVVLGVISWSFECIAFYYVFIGFDYEVPLASATFTLAFSSIVGGVSMLPGGLGAAEGSLVGLLVKFIEVPTNVAAAATIMIRLCTLWFGVLVGTIAIVSNRMLLGLVNTKLTEENIGRAKGKNEVDDKGAGLKYERRGNPD